MADAMTTSDESNGVTTGGGEAGYDVGIDGVTAKDGDNGQGDTNKYDDQQAVVQPLVQAPDRMPDDQQLVQKPARTLYAQTPEGLWIMQDPNGSRYHVWDDNGYLNGYAYEGDMPPGASEAEPPELYPEPAPLPPLRDMSADLLGYFRAKRTAVFDGKILAALTNHPDDEFTAACREIYSKGRANQGWDAPTGTAEPIWTPTGQRVQSAIDLPTASAAQGTQEQPPAAAPAPVAPATAPADTPGTDDPAQTAGNANPQGTNGGTEPVNPEVTAPVESTSAPTSADEPRLPPPGKAWVQIRPLNLPGLRSTTDGPSYHSRFLYYDRTDSGYYAKEGDRAEGVRADDSELKSQYKEVGQPLDADLLRQADAEIKPKFDRNYPDGAAVPYGLFLHNCHDYTSAVLSTYYRLQYVKNNPGANVDAFKYTPEQLNTFEQLGRSGD